MKLELQNLSQQFGTAHVLRDITLHLDNSRSLVLVGPSGGGKSTLLRILAGLDTPSAGSVTINGEKVKFDEPSLLIHRRSVGTVFQAFNLFPHLSGLENILLPLIKVHHLSPSEATERAYHYLKRFQLEDHAYKKPAELSGGQRQRIAIVRAVATQPKILLFDEPTSALDPEMTAEVLRLIEELRNEGRDFILATHEISFARRVADEIAYVANGDILHHAPADSFFSNPVPEVKSFLNKILL